MNKEELTTLPMPQGTWHCSCLEHCFLFPVLSFPSACISGSGVSMPPCYALPPILHPTVPPLLVRSCPSSPAPYQPTTVRSSQPPCSAPPHHASAHAAPHPKPTLPHPHPCQTLTPALPPPLPHLRPRLHKLRVALQHATQCAVCVNAASIWTYQPHSCIKCCKHGCNHVVCVNTLTILQVEFLMQHKTQHNTQCNTQSV